MAAEEELRARAVLAEMLMRISQGPYAALSILESASAEEVRGAFLELTKQFHPARFGRMSNDLQRMSNEVFLGIKAAHDQLVKLLGSTGRPAPARGSTSPGAGTGGTVRGTGLVPKPGPQPSPLNRGSDRPTSSRPSTPVMTTPASGMPRAASPLTTPTGARAPTPQATQPMARGLTPALGVPMRPTTPQGESERRETTGVAAAPTRPATPPITERRLNLPGTPERRPTPPGGVTAQRPTSPHGIPRPNTPQRAPASEAASPATIRYTGAQPPPQSKSAATDESAELKHAMDLLTSKDWTAARLAFHALAAKVPQSRQYRALLCYARGRETQATGRADDATMEFQRALQLDPELQIAKDALRDLGRKSRW
ncbi:MAG TPA: hypothetical protein VIV11_19520 [Kofleriaceae bacterium]